MTCSRGCAGCSRSALWDQAERRLLLARDRLGIKPLYYFRGDGFLLFASEVRALLATGLVPRRLDATALWQYLGYQSVPAPRTLVDGVQALRPGSWMTIGADGRRDESDGTGTCWTPRRRRVDRVGRRGPAAVGDLLRDAVAAHMVSDVPVGAFLSGGIDSSAVVALMREAGHTPRTFSVGFDEQRVRRERSRASSSPEFRTEHTHIRARRDHDLLDQLPAALRSMDQPTGDGVNTYVVSQAVRARRYHRRAVRALAATKCSAAIRRSRG